MDTLTAQRNTNKARKALVIQLGTDASAVAVDKPFSKTVYKVNCEMFFTQQQ